MSTCASNQETTPSASIGELRQRVVTDILAGEVRNYGQVSWSLLRDLGVAYLEDDQYSRYVEHNTLAPQLMRAGSGHSVRVTGGQRRTLMFHTGKAGPVILSLEEAHVEPKRPFFVEMAQRVGETVLNSEKLPNVETLLVTSRDAVEALRFNHRSQQLDGLTMPIARAMLQIPERPVVEPAWASSLRAA